MTSNANKDATLIGKANITSPHLEIPLSLEKIFAGFPAPNNGYIDDCLDLNELCIQHPNASYIFKVAGESMIEAGILPGDYLVVDRSKEPRKGDIVIATVYNDFTVKYLDYINGKACLVPANSAYEPIVITEEMECEIVGVVVSSIRKY